MQRIAGKRFNSRFRITVVQPVKLTRTYPNESSTNNIFQTSRQTVYNKRSRVYWFVDMNVRLTRASSIKVGYGVFATRRNRRDR